MPRLTQSFPKYPKHRGSGQAVTTIGGKDFYRGPYGTRASKREYDRLIAEWLAADRSATFGKPAEVLTIVEIAVAYLHHAKRYYGTGDTSEFHRIQLAIKPLRAMYGRTEAASFGHVEFKAVRQRFVDAENARSYVNAQAKRVSRMFRWAASKGLVAPRVPQMLAMIPSLRRGRCDARETDPVLPADNEVVKAVLPHLSRGGRRHGSFAATHRHASRRAVFADTWRHRSDEGCLGVPPAEAQDGLPRPPASGVHGP